MMWILKSKAKQNKIYRFIAPVDLSEEVDKAKAKGDTDVFVFTGFGLTVLDISDFKEVPDKEKNDVEN